MIEDHASMIAENYNKIVGEQSSPQGKYQSKKQQGNTENMLLEENGSNEYR